MSEARKRQRYIRRQLDNEFSVTLEYVNGKQMI